MTGPLLLRTQVALEDCERHLDTTATKGSPIEAYLTQYVLVTMCAEVQETFIAMLQAIAERGCDTDTATLTKALIKKSVKGASKDFMAETLDLFGRGYKQQFNGMLEEAQVVRYKNAVSERHLVAHYSGTNISLLDLRLAVTAAIHILSQAQFVLQSGGQARGRTGPNRTATP